MDSPAASMDSDESSSPSSSSDSFDSMLEDWDREDAMILQMMTIAHNNTRLLMMSDDEWSDEEEEEEEGRDKDKDKEKEKEKEIDQEEEEEDGEPSVNPNTAVRDASAMATAAAAVNFVNGSLNGYDHHVLGMAAPSPATNSSNGGVRDASAVAAPAVNSLNAYDRHVKLGMANPAPATNSSNVGVGDVSAVKNSLNGCDRHVFGMAAPASASAPVTNPSNGGVRDDVPAMADPATHAQEWRTTRARHPCVNKEAVKETEAEAEEEEDEVKEENLEGIASLAFLPSGSMSGHFLHPASSTCLGLFGTGQ